jgi:hypothetical protein
MMRSRRPPSIHTRRPMPGRAGSVLLALAAISLVLTGCGTSKPTQAQYVAKANAICAGAGAQTKPLIAQVGSAAGSLSSGGQTAARQLAAALQNLNAVTRSSLAKLRALEEPTSGHATITRFLSSYGALSGALGSAAAAAGAGQPQQALAQLAKALPVSQQMASTATAYGMSRCASLLPALGGTPSAQPIHATLLGENHHPKVNRPWRYTVTVTDAQGNKLSGTETTHYAFNGVVVGTEQPQNVRFTGGVYRDTIKFPPAAVGHPLELEVVIQASAGSVTVHWPIEVLE